MEERIAAFLAAHREEMLLAAGLFFFVGGASDWDWLCGGRGAPHPAVR